MNLFVFSLFSIFLLNQFYFATSASNYKSSWQTIETRLLKKYDRRHRPVHKESTSTNVRVLMMVNHIEEIDEHEQTMLVHGVMWVNWKDEYLVWNPNDFNGTTWIQIPSWRVWQPSLSLYNSARSNSWHLYLNGQPHGVSSDGSVYATGVFSFHVTCGFDFSNYPNDEQKCPIVIADWVYDLSKVNLTNGAFDKTSSTVRLSSNPFGGEQKRHIGGWEVTGSYETVCYFGPNGCEKQYPNKPYPLDNYWSLIEFGIRIKRHAPYFMTTIQLPIMVSSIMALFTFWIEDLNFSIAICLAAMMLECFTGYSLMKMLPPSTNRAPNIVYCYSYTFTLGLLILTFHVCLIFAQNILPEDVKLNFRWTALTEWLRKQFIFKTDNLKFASFDPDSLIDSISTKSQTDDLIDIQGPHQTQQQQLVNPNFLDIDDFETNPKQNTFIEMDSLTPEKVSQKSSSSNNSLINNLESQQMEPTTSGATSIIQLDDVLEEEEKPVNQQKLKDEEEKVSKMDNKGKKKLTHLEQEMHTLRRIAFFITLLIQILIIAWFI